VLLLHRGLVIKPTVGTCIAYDGGLHHAAHPVLEGTRTTAVFHLKKKVEEGIVGSRLRVETRGADPIDGRAAQSARDASAQEGAREAQAVAPRARGRAWRVVSSKELTRGLNGRPLWSALVARAGFGDSAELPMAAWKEWRRHRTGERSREVEREAIRGEKAVSEQVGHVVPKDEV
jgi:hypothetical protein